jgi:hypothetical protein
VRGISGAPTIACSAGDTGFGRVMPVALFFFGAAAGAAGDLDEAAAARTTTAEAERRGGAKEAVGGVEPCRGTGSEKESDATVSMGTAAIWTRLCGWSLGLVRIMARVFFFTFSDSFLIIRQGVQRSKQDPNYKGYMKQKNNWVLDSSIQ